MLRANVLRAQLVAALSTPIATATEAEARWARAYHVYASEAEDVSGDALVSSDPAGFRRRLRFAAAGSAEAWARQLDDAVVAYWTGATFGTGSLIVGLGDPCPNTGAGTLEFDSETSSEVVEVVSGVVARYLRPILRPSVSSRDTLGRLATALHMATLEAVRVEIVGLDTTVPPAGPLPVANTCAIR